MKTLKLLIITALLSVFTIQKTRAQVAVYDPVNNAVLAATQAIQESGFMQVFTGIMDVAKVGQDVIKIASGLVDIYKSSEEVLNSSMKLVGIYEVYFDAVVFLSENLLYLDQLEFDYLIKTMDACAFRYKGNITSRPRTPKDLAGGKLNETMNLLYAATTGGQISLFEITKLIKELTNQIDKTYSNTVGGLSYIVQAVETKKRNLGVYNIDDFVKDKTKKQSWLNN